MHELQRLVTRDEPEPECDYQESVRCCEPFQNRISGAGRDLRDTIVDLTSAESMLSVRIGRINELVINGIDGVTLAAMTVSFLLCPNRFVTISPLVLNSRL